jgi:hypothetical protein
MADEDVSRLGKETDWFDSSSVNDVVALLRHDIDEIPYEWALKNAIIATVVLIHRPEGTLGLAPTGAGRVLYEPPFEYLMGAEFIRKRAFSREEYDSHLSDLNHAIQEPKGTALLRRRFEQTRNHQNDKIRRTYEAWIQHETWFRWPTYSAQTEHGLWTPALNGFIAAVARKKLKHVEKLRADTSDPNILRMHIDSAKNGINPKSDVGEVADCYLAAALGRGEIMGYAADGALYQAQIRRMHLEDASQPMMVPVRDQLLATREEDVLAKYHFALRIMATAFEHSGEDTDARTKARIEAWIEGLRNARSYLKSNPQALAGANDGDERAESLAAEAARKSGLIPGWLRYNSFLKHLHRHEFIGLATVGAHFVTSATGVHGLPGAAVDLGSFAALEVAGHIARKRSAKADQTADRIKQRAQRLRQKARLVDLWKL